METTISLNELTTDGLSAKALAMISEFALILYRQEGTIIDVHSDNVLVEVFTIGRKSRNIRLRSIYLHLRTELATNIAIARYGNGYGNKVMPVDPAVQTLEKQTRDYGMPNPSDFVS